MTWLIAISLVLCCLCVAWTVMLQPWGPRLRLADMPLPPPADVVLPRPAGAPRVPLAGLFALAGKLIPRPGAGNSLRDQLLYSGSRLTVEEFQGVKVLSAVLVAVGFAVVAREADLARPPFIAVAALVGFLFPTIWLRSRLANRHRSIVRLLPEVIDLLALCVGAGVDFLGALNEVVLVKSPAKNKKDPLIEELTFTLQEIKLGKRKIEALRSMGKRVSLPEVTSFVRTMVQAERMGTPVAEVLAVHSEDMRFHRFMRAERAAMKAPIKILVPLIFCIMPCVALIVGAPIFLQFMRENPFAK